MDWQDKAVMIGQFFLEGVLAIALVKTVQLHWSVNGPTNERIYAREDT